MAHRPKHRKQSVLAFIERYIAATGKAPTNLEIRKRFEMRSSASVHQILVSLEREGLIERTPNISRGIKVVQQPVNAS